MRSVILLAIVSSLLAAPLTSASQMYTSFADAHGDTGIWGGRAFASSLGMDGSLGALADCTAPAADIHQLTLWSDGDVLYAELTVDEFTYDVECSIVGMGDAAESVGYSVDVRRADPDATGVVGVFAAARTTGFGLASCISIGYSDAGSRCVLASPMNASDSTLHWSIPLVGVTPVLVSGEFGESDRWEDRAYDLSGLEFEAAASAHVALDSPLGLIEIRDWTETPGERFTL